MKRYVLDANALVRYIRGTEGADKVRGIFRQCEQGLANISMSVVNLGEAYYILLRRLGEVVTGKAVSTVGNVISFVPVELEQAIAAAKIKEQFKMGYADSFAASLAIRSNCILVTADPEFEKLGRALKLLKLPRHAEK